MSYNTVHYLRQRSFFYMRLHWSSLNLRVGGNSKQVDKLTGSQVNLLGSEAFHHSEFNIIGIVKHTYLLTCQPVS